MAGEIEIGIRQKLREDFISGETNTFTDESLLELLLSYALSRGDPEPLAKRLILEFGGLDGVLSSDFNALCRIKGVKSYTATLLKLAGHLRFKETARDPQSWTAGKPQKSQIEIKSPSQHEPTTLQHIAGPIHRSSAARPKSELFTNSVLKEAIELLPALPDTEDIGIIRAFLKENLPFSSQNTRDRYVPYVVNRLFPDRRADLALRSFARIYSGRQELRDACFYRFCKAEPLMLSVCHDLLLPAIGYGQMDRARIREYLSDRYPSSKVVNLCAKAIVNSLVAGGLARSDKRKISFNYRAPAMASLAFLIHSEFPAPGMYEISWLENSPLIRAMLWDPDRLLPELYELRNLGLISKISEIDNIRQFTTEFTLDELVDHMKSRAKPV